VASLQFARRKVAAESRSLANTAEFARFHALQPFLEQRISQRLAAPLDDLARGFGAELALITFLAFEHAFGDRLRTVSEQDWDRAETLWNADELLRKNDASACLESEDVVAMHQPELTAFARSVLDETIAGAGEALDLDDIDAAYRLVLIEVLALSYAVEPLGTPSGEGPGFAS